MLLVCKEKIHTSPLLMSDQSSEEKKLLDRNDDAERRAQKKI